MVHAEAVRDETGSVSTTTATTGSVTGLTGTEQIAKLNDLVGFEGATLNVANTAGTPTVNLKRGGNTVTSVAGAGTSTQAVVLQDPALNAPTYSVTLTGGTSADVTATINREQRW